MSKIAFYFGAHPDDWIFFHGEQAYSDLLNCDKDVLFLPLQMTLPGKKRGKNLIKGKDLQSAFADLKKVLESAHPS